MTIPWMMNCKHSADGWCIECVKALGERAAAMEERLGPISPQGDDKIDEQEATIRFLRHHVETCEKLIAILHGEAEPGKPLAPNGYYILCTRNGYADGHLLWWRPNGAGYTPALAEAGVYTHDEAVECSTPGGDRMIPCYKAWELARWVKPVQGKWVCGFDAEKALKAIGTKTRARATKGGAA